jgi:choline monooxygenase
VDEKLLSIMSKSQCDAVMAPIDRALTLPAQAYTDEAWFALEKERIFRRHWMAVLFDCALPDIGDVVPLDILGMPLVAVRGSDRKLRIFHNICPYDGCLVVRSAATKLAGFET